MGIAPDSADFGGQLIIFLCLLFGYAFKQVWRRQFGVCLRSVDKFALSCVKCPLGGVCGYRQHWKDRDRKVSGVCSPASPSQ